MTRAPQNAWRSRKNRRFERHPPSRRAIAVVLALFAFVFAILQVNGYTKTAATWDEPMHLTAGYAALAHRDFRIDPSHPPFLRMWSALPLLALPHRDLDLAVVDRTSNPGWLTASYDFARGFLYVDNDADRLLYAARFMVVLWGIVLGVLLFAWAVEWLGFAAAVFTLAIYTVEPNLSGHSALVTTDFGLTCFMFAAIYFLWRASIHFSAANVAMVALCAALAAVTKFSAIVLAPVLVILLFVAARSRTAMTWTRASVLLGIVAVSTLAAVWAVYAFHYAPSPSTSDGWDVAHLALANNAPRLAAAVEWSDRHRLLPNAFSQGLLLSQASVRQLPGFLAGRIAAGGWWYYFPIAFLMKTPVAVLVLFAGGMVSLVFAHRRREATPIWFLVVPLAIYLVTAMASGINLGVRHILPIYPFVVLIAGACARQLLGHRRLVFRVAAALILLVAIAEFAGTYPYPLTFFNTFVGGPTEGFRYLADSNLGWGSNLKPLKQWMDRHGVEHMNLAYFGSAEPAYYHIDATYLPGSPTFLERKVARPRLPGYVAISPTVLNGVYIPPWWRLFYRGFYESEPVAIVGNSIRVYWVQTWPEDAADATEPEVHGLLADALAHQGWFEHAAVHYHRYLHGYPRSTAGWNGLGISAAQVGRGEEALEAFRRAAELSPGDSAVRENLANAVRRWAPSFPGASAIPAAR